MQLFFVYLMGTVPFAWSFMPQEDFWIVTRYLLCWIPVVNPAIKVGLGVKAAMEAAEKLKAYLKN